MRTKQLFGVVRGALRDASGRFGFRIVHYSVQSNHLHLLVEALGAGALSRGVIGLQVRIARGLNTLLGRRGSVFSGRYHARTLKTPSEVRNALAYVLLNARKHAAERGQRYHAGWLDPCSSSKAFDGWRGRPPDADPLDITSKPKTWLLSVGWRKRGLLEPSEVPRHSEREPSRRRRAARP